MTCFYRPLRVHQPRMKGAGVDPSPGAAERGGGGSV